MSTRSVIAIPTDNGFRGRYCHADGMPPSMLPLLRNLIAERGVEAARAVLTEQHYGWSMIHPEPERYADHLGDRAVVVAGVGIAYPNAETGDEWITSTGDNTMLEWAYVLNDTGIAVFTNAGGGERPWQHVANVKNTDELTKEITATIECGEKFERCGHYAWFHGVGDRDSRMGMSAWLGNRPLTGNDITRVLAQVSPIAYGTAEFTLTGSAGTGTASSSRYDYNAPASKPRYWWVDTMNSDGKRTGSKRLGRITKAGLKLDTPALLPATSVAPEHWVAAGTVLPLH